MELAVQAVFDSLSLGIADRGIAAVDMSRITAGVDRDLVAGRLSMEQVRQSEVVRCPPIQGRPRDRNCFIEGADHLVTIHTVTLSGETVSVEVEVQGEHEGEGYRIVWSGGFEVQLARSGSNWTVKALRDLWQKN